MRVALLNNNNNNFFAFARYLRDLGVDAHVFVIDPLPDHFLPPADTFEDSCSLSYVHYLDGEAMRQWRVTRVIRFFKQLKQLYVDLASFDIIVACGNLSYFAIKNIKIDVFMPYGGDIFQLIVQHTLSKRRGLIHLYHRCLACLQRKAIKNSRIVMALASIDGNVHQALKKLNKPWLEKAVPMVYPTQIADVSEQWDFLKDHDFILFSHTRQSWYQVEDYKGNEKYIKAFARFVKTECNFHAPILVLFEYGLTILASKELITSLGIDQYVKWMPKMSRKDIFFGLSKASLAIDALTDKVASFGGVVFESFMYAIPTIGTATISSAVPANTVLPLVHAFTEQDVHRILVDYQRLPGKYKQIGLVARKWFHDNIGIYHANKCKKLFELLMHNPEVPVDDSDFYQEILKIWDVNLAETQNLLMDRSKCAE